MDELDPLDADLESTDIEVDDEDDFRATEPFGAVRLSPFGVAAFIVSLLAVFEMGNYASTALSVQRSDLIRVAGSILLPAALAVVARWLAGRSEEEIFLADGKLGGVGFYKAARVLGVLVLVLLAAGLVTAFALNNHSFQIN